MVGMAMNPHRAESLIGQWFGEVGAASMELPDGWLGRPRDNQHRLTWTAVRDDKVFLELDGQVHLVATISGAEEAPGRLVVDTRRLVVDRRAYGTSGDFETRVYERGGLVTFHAGL